MVQHSGASSGWMHRERRATNSKPNKKRQIQNIIQWRSGIRNRCSLSINEVFSAAHLWHYKFIWTTMTARLHLPRFVDDTKKRKKEETSRIWFFICHQTVENWIHRFFSIFISLILPFNFIGYYVSFVAVLFVILFREIDLLGADR